MYLYSIRVIAHDSDGSIAILDTYSFAARVAALNFMHAYNLGAVSYPAASIEPLFQYTVEEYENATSVQPYSTD